MTRNPSPTCLGLVKKFEGCRLTAYKDSVGVLTIGYGHTKGVKPGQRITQEQADSLLRADLAETADSVNRYAPETSQNQFDALVSFAFNLGFGALAGSTLLRMHNEGDYAGAAGQFHRWDHAGGRVLKGLTLRRSAEEQLYRGDAA